MPDRPREPSPATVVIIGPAFKGMAAVSVSAPLVPVIVMEAAEDPAEADAVSCSEAVLPGATEPGVKAPVIPDGKPVAARATGPLKPFRAVTPMVVAVVEPGPNTREDGFALKSNPGTAVTVRLTGSASLTFPEAPVTLNGALEADADAAAVRVSVDEPAGASDGGTKTPVTPAGKPVRAKVTLPLNPPEGVAATDVVTEEPDVIVNEAG